MDEAAITKDVIGDWERGQAERGETMNHWQQCANFMQPNRADYTVERSPGQKRFQYIYDSTPLWALEQFQNGLHSYLTSPFLPWFMLKADDDAVNNVFSVRSWFDQASAAMYDIFNGPRHNFASQSQEVYGDLGMIGSGVMACLESQRSGILFSTRHMKECVYFENEEDRVDRLSRRWRYTAKQAVQAWGKAAGEKVIKAYDDGKPETKFWFHHRVMPRLTRDPQRRDARHKAFESVYVGEADKNLISVGGFDDFPYLCPRLMKVSGETYGRGFGMTMLADVKMLNEMVKTVMRGAQKVVDPPLMMPDDGFLMPIKTGPGTFNFYRAGTRQSDRIMPIETKGDTRLGIEMINALRQNIIRGFYVEYLMMPSDPKDPASTGKGITATYVLQQRDEKMRLLSPMLARLQSEFLEPLIIRVFNILWRRSMVLGFGPGSPFPPPPAELRGVRWHVEYVSPIAVAQKSSELGIVDRLMQRQQQLRQMDPEQPMVIDGEAVLRLESRDLNAPAVLLKTPERLQQEQQARQQAAQQQHQAELAAKVGAAAKDGGAGIKSLTDAHVSLGGGAGAMQEAA